jgi:surface antigen
MDKAAIRFGLTAALALGSLGLYSSTALAGGSGWAQQPHPDNRPNNQNEQRGHPQQRAVERQPQRQQAAPQQQRQQQQVDQRRQQGERFRAQQNQRPQFGQQRQQTDQQRQQNDRFRAQQNQRQQFDQQQGRQQADRQRQQNDRFRAQQNQRQYGQRPDDRRAADYRNDGRRDSRWNWSQPQRHDNWHGNDHNYRGPGWDSWRQRHYVSAPRYRWDYDRYSRPWFDYNRVGYISIYRPTYVIPYNAYESYGSSYYGPVGCNRDVVGAVLGGVAGGLIGAHNGGGGATVGGAIVGALLGGALGQSIDMSDQACYGQVLEYAPSNQPVYWEGDGAQYQVTPMRTYQNGSGEYCREYQSYIYIDGQEQQAYGTACRQPDGAWRSS